MGRRLSGDVCTRVFSAYVPYVRENSKNERHAVRAAICRALLPLLAIIAKGLHQAPVDALHEAVLLLSYLPPLRGVSSVGLAMRKAMRMAGVNPYIADRDLSRARDIVGAERSAGRPVRVRRRAVVAWELHRNGMSWAAIATRFNCDAPGLRQSVIRLQRLLKAHGVEPTTV
jgi:hypothetical protein